jgi:hypothetical protein
MSDNYDKWLRENGVEPSEDGADPAAKTIPWWILVIIATIGANAIRHLIAFVNVTPCRFVLAHRSSCASRISIR